MIATHTQDLPWLTTEQMIEVDRAMIEAFGIDLTRMMENAGRALAIVASECFLDSNPDAAIYRDDEANSGARSGSRASAAKPRSWSVAYPSRDAPRHPPPPNDRERSRHLPSGGSPRCSHRNARDPKNQRRRKIGIKPVFDDVHGAVNRTVHDA